MIDPVKDNVRWFEAACFVNHTSGEVAHDLVSNGRRPNTAHKNRERVGIET
jgi:hypothetical protein